MISRLQASLDAIKAAIKAAGGLIQAQDDETKRAVQNAPQKPAIPMFPGGVPLGTPVNPNATVNQQMYKMMTGQDAPKPVTRTDGNQAGMFPLDASPEPSAALTLDDIVAHLSSADGDFLLTLSSQWGDVAQGLTDSIALFNGAFQSILTTPGMWTGELATQMKASLTTFTTTTGAIADQALNNGSSILVWGLGVSGTKSTVESLAATRTTAIAAAPAETKLLVKDNFDQMARQAMEAHYNPAVSAISGGLVNLSDPQSPVLGTPLLLPGMTPQGSNGSNPLAAAPVFTNGGGGGGGGGAGGGGGGGTSSTKNTPAGTLQKSGTGTPPPSTTTPTPTPTPGPSKSGLGDPVSGANSALSKAGSGLGGAGRNGAATRAAGLAAAEKAAAEKAAKAALGGKGGGAGGGGGGLGGGAGAKEPALQARAGVMGAAEKMAAAEQAAMSNSRAAAGGPMGAAPMGAGARPGGEDGKGHKANKYLHSKENGEEIVGEVADVAPTVIGGLNLDTTDDRPVRGQSPRP